MSQTILIAEDDRFLANAYRVAFEQEGFSVDIVLDGKEALAHMKANKPSVLVLDLLMPEVDGFGVLEAMKADPNLSSVPVIVASNLGSEDDIAKAKKLGANDYIIKSDTTIRSVIDKVKALAGA